MNYSDMDNYYLDWEIRHERNCNALAFDIWFLKWSAVMLISTTAFLYGALICL